MDYAYHLNQAAGFEQAGYGALAAADPSALGVPYHDFGRCTVPGMSQPYGYPPMRPYPMGPSMASAAASCSMMARPRDHQQMFSASKLIS